MFRTAVEKAKEQIDYAIDVLKQDGYPPLTLPLTLARLNKMAPKDAVRELQNRCDQLTDDNRLFQTELASAMDQIHSG